MSQRSNLRYHLSKDGVARSTKVSEKNLKIAQEKASELIHKSPDNLFGTLCVACKPENASRMEEKDLVLYCYGCGKYYFNSIDITSHE